MIFKKFHHCITQNCIDAFPLEDASSSQVEHLSRNDFSRDLSVCGRYRGSESRLISHLLSELCHRLSELSLAHCTGPLIRRSRCRPCLSAFRRQIRGALSVRLTSGLSRCRISVSMAGRCSTCVNQGQAADQAAGQAWLDWVSASGEWSPCYVRCGTPISVLPRLTSRGCSRVSGGHIPATSAGPASDVFIHQVNGAPCCR